MIKATETVLVDGDEEDEEERAFVDEIVSMQEGHQPKKNGRKKIVTPHQKVKPCFAFLQVLCTPKYERGLCVPTSGLRLDMVSSVVVLRLCFRPGAKGGHGEYN